MKILFVKIKNEIDAIEKETIDIKELMNYFWKYWTKKNRQEKQCNKNNAF